MVVHAVHLTRPRRPRRHADGTVQRRFARQQRLGDRPLAAARWRAQHEAHTAARDLRHSMFCTCSRSCSIVAFSFRPVLVNATDADLLHSVLASRLNSCTRKSKRRPIFDALLHQPPRGTDMRRQPIQFLPHIRPRRQQRHLLGDPFLGQRRRFAQQRAQRLHHPRLMRGGLIGGLRLGLIAQPGDFIQLARHDRGQTRRPRPRAPPPARPTPRRIRPARRLPRVSRSCAGSAGAWRITPGMVSNDSARGTGLPLMRRCSSSARVMTFASAASSIEARGFHVPPHRQIGVDVAAFQHFADHLAIAGLQRVPPRSAGGTAAPVRDR